LKAIIPVAGYGTRLKPHTNRYQKSLLPVAGKPALDFIVEPLLDSGFDEITFIVGHFKDQVIDHMKKYDGNFSFEEQKERLGLGHAILTGLGDSNNPVLVQLGDTIFDINYNEFCSADHNLIGIYEVDDPSRFGVVEKVGDRIINLYEKHPNPPSNLAISGIYYFNDENILKTAIESLIERDIRTNDEYQITDAMQLMVKDGQPFKIFNTPEIFDVGVPETFLSSNRKLLRSKYDDFPSSKLIEPVFIGKNCTVEDSIIGPFVTIMDNCIIKNSKIEDSIILEDSDISDNQIIGKIAAKDGSEFC
jgi:glucose-1-phosphate thymidylyltransferase